MEITWRMDYRTVHDKHSQIEFLKVPMYNKNANSVSGVDM
jgi:hypothetical protein